MPDLFAIAKPRRSKARLTAASLAVAVVLSSFTGCSRDDEGIGKESRFAKLVPAEALENAASQKYRELLLLARQQNALFPPQDPHLVRLTDIARRVIPHALAWNPRAKQWRWEVNLVNAKELNAMCMPGGKIVFYSAIIDKLKLTDDEIAIVMGHETAHALREHARARMGKSAATGLAAGLVSQLLGLNSTGDQLLNMGNQLLNLKFSREDETEADLVGMELAARAGYDPRAGVTLWQKMAVAAKGAPPEFISTHPSDGSRIKQIEANLPKVLPLYERADKPSRR